MSMFSVHNLAKRFGGLIAVNDVSFCAEAGEILGVIGPNGAGKTTVFNLITGNYRPDHGEIILKGKHIHTLQPHQIVESGITRTFQNLRLFQGMTVLENALAGRHSRMRAGFFSSLFHLPAHRKEETASIERAMQELAFVGLDSLYDIPAKNLSYGNQRLLEIARALASDPQLLILDEPAGGMNDQETLELTHLISLLRKRGLTILLIEHDMNLVMKLCDRLVVLEHGQVIANGTPDEVKNNPLVIEAYLGTDDDS